MIADLMDSQAGCSRLPGLQGVVQATLLFGAEAWVVPPGIGETLGRFHHRVDLRIVGMWMRRDMMGRRVFPPLDMAMMEVGL